MSTRWITLEGIEGVGKSYLGQRLAARLGSRCQLLSEVTDATSDRLTSHVITALSRSGDLWLRTGWPITETLALLALKVAEYERAPLGSGAPEIIIEDRGIDSVAVYQGLIMAGLDGSDDDAHRYMERIYATAARWRPLPDLTILLGDDPTSCLVRLQQRTGQAIIDADRLLIARAAKLYAWQAAREPGRFRFISRAGQSADATVDELVRACLMPDHGGM